MIYVAHFLLGLLVPTIHLIAAYVAVSFVTGDYRHEV